MNRMFMASLIVNVVFVVAEAWIGFVSHSLGLVSDAGHNLSDVLGIALAMLAFWLERRKTAGCRSVSRWVTVINALLLLVAVVLIVVEGVHRLNNREAIDGAVMMYTAGAGILVNGFTAWLLMRGRQADVNVRAAYLHAASDTLVSVGVVVSGLLIALTGWTVIDALVSLLISIVIGVPALKLLVESLHRLREND